VLANVRWMDHESCARNVKRRSDKANAYSAVVLETARKQLPSEYETCQYTSNSIIESVHKEGFL
jgi:hypothetical protein